MAANPSLKDLTGFKLESNGDLTLDSTTAVSDVAERLLESAGPQYRYTASGQGGAHEHVTIFD